MVGQSREEGFYEAREVPTTAVGSYQTVPRLQDHTAELVLNVIMDVLGGWS